MATTVENKEDDVVIIELPAPAGWIKKFIPKKAGTPGKNDIVFISPTGEEIKHKRQLEQYLKSNPGGPTTSEFDWGLGESPRRSVRLSEKSKTVKVEDESPHKKQKSSNTKKGSRKVTDYPDDEVDSTDDKEAATEQKPEPEKTQNDDVKRDEAEKPEITPNAEAKIEGSTNIADEVTPNAEAKIEGSTNITDEVTPNAEAKIEGSTNIADEVTSIKDEELNESKAEIVDTNMDELKDEHQSEKEKDEESAKNKDNDSEEKQVDENLENK